LSFYDCHRNSSAVGDLMILFKRPQLRILIDGSRHVTVDHNAIHADAQIEIRDVESVEIRGNSADELPWWKKPLGIIALAVAAGLVVAGIKFYLGW
jgi:hypothetical protein